MLMASQGQVRLAPSGHVIGVDLNVTSQIAAAKGYDIAVLAELLPVAETGMVDGLASATQGSG